MEAAKGLRRDGTQEFTSRFTPYLAIRAIMP
jgi:hypothetical protein